MNDNQKGSGAKTFVDHINFKTNEVCRMCGSSFLDIWLDLGNQPLANSFLKKEDLEKPEPVYPLKVFFCNDCGLSQLLDIVNPEVMFRDYVYFSSVMPKVSEHWMSYANDIVNNYVSSNDDLVVEIGSNDGVLLGAIQGLGPRVLGIDPARNIVALANERGIPTLPEFFSEKLSVELREKYGRAKAILGNNVVAHINDHQDLLSGVRELLSEDGVFVFEAPYLVDMFENLSFDTVYHEHMSYLSIRPIIKWLDRYGMEVFLVKILPIQGNSIRVYAGKKGRHNLDRSVSVLLDKELSLGMDKLDSYKILSRRIENLKTEVVGILNKLKNDGKKIAGYGAPAKGNTLLNYFNVGTDVLDFATEGMASKIGFYTPGMHIPVIDIVEGRVNNPDYFFMLAWNYKNAILSNESEFIKQGGKFIMPIGQDRIVP